MWQIILMKALVSRIYADPKNERFFSWMKLITITSGAQIVVQVVGLLSGIIVIRLLPTHEYGLYTLANTMLGTMIVLADGGVSIGVMAQGANVWQDRKQLGVVMVSGFDLLKKFAIVSLVISSPVLIYLLLHHGASWPMTLLIIASSIPAFYAALSDSMLEIAPKLHQSILPLQKNQVNVGIGRLLLSGIMLFIFPWAVAAIIASGLPRIYGNIKLRKIASFLTEADQLPDPAVKKDIIRVWKKSMPGLIYYCISGQLTVWLVSLFGNTAAVAQIGALGRIVMLLNLFSAVFSTLVAPRYARLPITPSLLKKKMLQIQLGLVGFFIAVIGLVYLFSGQILWVLGDKYIGLDDELVLLMIGSCFSLMTGLVYFLTSGRGWILTPWIYVTGSVVATIIGLFLFNISSMQGVLLFNIFISVCQLLMYIVYSWYMLTKPIIKGEEEALESSAKKNL